MRTSYIVGCSIIALSLAAPAPALAGEVDLKAKLRGFEEVPAVSTTASGEFRAVIDDDAIDFTLRYTGLTADATQAHIHFGQRGVNGGVSVFLCSNLASPPPGTPACPLRSGTVTGMRTASDVIGPAGQGIAAGEFRELVRAIRGGVAYANVHSTQFTGGEIRGQIKADDD